MQLLRAALVCTTCGLRARLSPTPTHPHTHATRAPTHTHDSLSFVGVRFIAYSKNPDNIHTPTHPHTQFPSTYPSACSARSTKYISRLIQLWHAAHGALEQCNHKQKRTHPMGCPRRRLLRRPPVAGPLCAQAGHAAACLQHPRRTPLGRRPPPGQLRRPRPCPPWRFVGRSAHQERPAQSMTDHRGW